MMKYILITFLCFAALSSVGQTFPSGFPTQFNTGWQKWGYSQSDSGTIIARRDTAWTPTYAGTIVLWRQASDTSYFFYTGQRWIKLLKTGDASSVLANQGLSLNGDTAQLGQLSGDADNPAILTSSREIPMAGNDINLSGPGRLLVDTGRIVVGIQVDPLYPFTVSHIYDSVTTSNFLSRVPKYENYAFKDVRFTEDTFSFGAISGDNTNLFGLVYRGKSVVDVSNTVNRFTGSHSVLFLRKYSGYADTTTFIGRSSPLSTTTAVPSGFSAVFSHSQGGLSSTNPNLATGWWAGLSSEISLGGSFNKIENYIWTHTGITGYGTVGADVITNGYGLYINPLTSAVTNKYAIYQPGTLDTNYLAGKNIFPNLVAQTDTSLYKPMVVDANGNLFKFDSWGASAAVFTANNGLNKSTPTNAQLGGDLVQNTIVGNIGQDFGITFNRLGTSAAVTVQAVSSVGTALNATTTSGTALVARSSSGLGGLVGINPSTTNTFDEIFRLERNSSGSAANGIGGYMSFTTKTSDNSLQQSGRIGAIWDDVTTGTRTSRMDFWTQNSATISRKMSISGPGQLTLDGYPALTQSIDTTNHKPLGYNTTTGVVEPMANWAGGGGVADSTVFAIVGDGERSIWISNDSVYFKTWKVGSGLSIITGADSIITISLTGGGGMTIGDPVAGGTGNSMLFVDVSGNLAQNNSSLAWNDGTSILTVGGNIYPSTTGTRYLGTATQRWEGISVNGINLNQGGTPTDNVLSVVAGFTLSSSSTPSSSGVNIFNFSSAQSLATSGTTNLQSITGPFNPTSGTAVYNWYNLQPLINQTGGANGITRALYINPTLTAAADFRAVEIANNAHWGVYQSGASARNYFAGETNFGNITDQGAFTLQNTGGLYQSGAISLNGIPEGNTSMNVLLHNNGSDSAVHQIPALTLFDYSVVTADPSDFAIAATFNYCILPDLAAAADANLTLPGSPRTGQRLTIHNKNSDVTNTWTFVTTVLDAAGSTVTAITNDTFYILVYDGTGWYISN